MGKVLSMLTRRGLTPADDLLLDVNVLLEIAWPNHRFHVAAVKALLSQNRWATRALTQLGFIRLSSNPAAIATCKSPQEAVGLLARLAADSLHTYLEGFPAPASEDWRDMFSGVLGHQQVTDAYLLWLAAVNNAVLVTYDRRLRALAGGQPRVIVLG